MRANRSLEQFAMTQEDYFTILRGNRANAQNQLDALTSGLKIVVNKVDRTATQSIGLKNIIRKYDRLLDAAP